MRRIALSEISKTFDPLGLFAPVLLTGKILLQEFWKEGKDWDDLTYDEINQKFCRYVENTKALCNIRIPRPICEGELMSIFAFGDASGKAYCAAIYTRYLKADGSYSCRLICSKTRVAPMKEVTIPKLELQAAKLVADLANRVCADLAISKKKNHRVLRFDYGFMLVIKTL